MIRDMRYILVRGFHNDLSASEGFLERQTAVRELPDKGTLSRGPAGTKVRHLPVTAAFGDTSSQPDSLCPRDIRLYHSSGAIGTATARTALVNHVGVTITPNIFPVSNRQLG